MNVLVILNLLRKHKTFVLRAFTGALTAFLIAYGVSLHNTNKSLSERLKMAQNNIEVYLGIVNNAQLANNVLKLDMKTLELLNDSLILKIDSVRKNIGIKPKALHTAATQTLTIYVTMDKGVRGDTIINTILKDTVYNDSIKYNDLTNVYYTIGRDTVSVTLDIKNTQYLYVYKHRLYKNKKSFIKRLFTLDFKKIDMYKYKIVNTNDIINTKDVRVIESIDK